MPRQQCEAASRTARDGGGITPAVVLLNIGASSDFLKGTLVCTHATLRFAFGCWRSTVRLTCGNSHSTQSMPVRVQRIPCAVWFIAVGLQDGLS